ncbi:MAG: helix-turn-helix domain-containing protein [Gammaproteobacteria bacterium]|nr:helix-turn-helix domain-containing protein [Gammaproteobacteria bacterium]
MPASLPVRYAQSLLRLSKLPEDELQLDRHQDQQNLDGALQKEGTSYQQFKEHCRRDVALEKLQAGAHTASQLAELLGFSDSRTFHRAFRKWTGQTPAEYRQQLDPNTPPN